LSRYASLIQSEFRKVRYAKIIIKPQRYVGTAIEEFESRPRDRVERCSWLNAIRPSMYRDRVSHPDAEPIVDRTDITGYVDPWADDGVTPLRFAPAVDMDKEVPASWATQWP
jgi:hypothetical protein